MSQYSQTYGSFIRTGNYPLEANYIFSTEQELIDFYTDNEEETHLHQGLFKIVGEGKSQSLYWVVKNGEELQFEKLIEDIDIDNIQQELTNLQTKLQEEITTREQEVSEIWGDDKESILTGLNNIKKISEALNTQIRNYNKLHEEFNAAVGTSDRDIIEYLKSLPYQSLTELSTALNDFLNGTTSDPEISTLPELKDFLEGFTNSDTLQSILEQLYNKIEGNPFPTLTTLRDLENSIVKHQIETDNKIGNIQTELDTTQNGVGLNQDGSYSPDTSSNYLQNATSITNALHILDNLIHTAIQEYNLETPDIGNIKLNAEKTLTGYKLSGNIKLNSDPGNQFIADSNGAYMKVDLTYEAGDIKLLVNGNIVSHFNIVAKNIIQDAYYDAATESVVIYFKLTDGSIETVRIPVGNLIREWDIDNSDSSKVVELTKTQLIEGTDKLSADVRLSTKTDNILVKDGNTLYVGKNQIDSDLSTSINNLKLELTTAINNAVTIEKDRATARENYINDLVTGEIDRSTAEDASIRNSITNLIQQLADSKAIIDNLVERVVALETKTSW